MFDKMKQLMEFQKAAKETERQLSEIRVEKEALGGKLRLVMNGHHRVESVSIDDSFLNPGQRENLERVLTVLITETGEAVRRESATRAMEMMKGLKVPGT